MNFPRHVAIIMDGNGRWAKQRFLPRIAGHQQAIESIHAMVSHCVKLKIPILTLFAFSSENWRRPQTEVSFLLTLFLKTLKEEIKALHSNNIRLTVIGDRHSLNAELQLAIGEAEKLTEANTGLQLNIALNYGGRWDIVQAARLLAERAIKGELLPEAISETHLQGHLSLSKGCDPDLLIRTGGEYRISNFLLWQFAYTELYFTETLWPDFREPEFDIALKDFSKRQRRFGYTSEQVEEQQCLKQE